MSAANPIFPPSAATSDGKDTFVEYPTAVTFTKTGKSQYGFGCDYRRFEESGNGCTIVIRWEAMSKWEDGSVTRRYFCSSCAKWYALKALHA